MTSNQIAYWRLQEDTRAHLAQEAENYRSAKAREVENYRHNVATEAQAAKELQETNRANQAKEDETHRHNKWNEWEGGIMDSWAKGETTRHNLATEDIERLKAVKMSAPVNNSTYNVITGSYNYDMSESNQTNYQNPIYDLINNWPGIHGAIDWLITGD